MRLVPGDRLGPYQVVAHLGSGGMGEVYKARDTRLERHVALKILPDAVSLDPERRKRFEREARATSALNAPGIVDIYDIGTAGDITFIVLELIDGSTLRHVIRDGVVPVRTALDWVAQVADALAVTHRSGIVHRDLKPENIMVCRDGSVRVLDFGIAALSGSVPAADAITETALTGRDVVLGTPAYMSPEQITGAQTGERSDLFSLGIILYEMLSGTNPFKQETAAETIAATLRSQPPELPPSVPVWVRSIVERCISKDPQHRFQSAADLAFAVRMVSQHPPASGGASQRVPQSLLKQKLHRVGWSILLFAGVAGSALWMGGRSVSTVDQVKFTPFATDPEAEIYPAFSPDGKSVSFRKGDDIYVRSLDSTAATQLTRGQPNPDQPSWAPDGSHIYYASLNTCFTVSSAGGTPSKVLDNCSWPAVSPDGNTLLFIRNHRDRRELWTSSMSGASARRLRDDLPEPALLLPSNRFSPDGSRLAYIDVRRQPWVVTLPQGEASKVPGVEGSIFASWFPDGRHVLVNCVPDVAVGFRFMIADTVRDLQHTIVQAPGVSISGDLNREGTRLAYSAGSADLNISEYDLTGSRLRSLAAGSQTEADPHWSPRGDQFAYISTALSHIGELWTTTADGKRSTRLVTGNTAVKGPRFSPDGRRIAYVSADTLWIVPAEGGRSVPVYKGTSMLNSAPAWSPDGEYLAVIDASGLMRVPASGGKPLQIQAFSGTDVRWSSNGRWLSYLRRGDRIDLISPQTGEVRLLAKATGAYLNGDFTPDGLRFLLVRRTARSPGWELVTLDPDTGRELKSAPLSLIDFEEPYFLSIHPDGQRIALNTGRLNYDIWMIQGVPRPATWLRKLFTWKSLWLTHQ